MIIINEKIIFKRFLSENTYFFLLTSLSVTFIVWVIQAVNNLDIVSEDGHSFFIYFYYTFLLFPKIFGKILPLVFFTSLFYTLSKYENNNELKIFWINGIHKIKFYKIILGYTFTFFLFQLFISSFLGPHFQNKARESVQNSNLDFFPSLFQEKKFIDTVEKLTIFIDKKNDKDEFIDIYLKDDSNINPKIIFAKKGFLLEVDSKRILRLIDGKFISVNRSGTNTHFNFEKTDFDLSKFLTKTTTHKKIQETNTLILLKCVKNQTSKKKDYDHKDVFCKKDSINEIASEVYNRIFKPLYLFLLSSIIIFLLTTNYENKNFNKTKLSVFSLGIFVIIISEITVNYSGKSELNMLISIFLPIIIFLILYTLFYKKTNYGNI